MSIHAQFVTIHADYCSALQFPAVFCARDTRPYKLAPRTEPTNSFESSRDSQETGEMLLLVYAATNMCIERYHILADYQHKNLSHTHTYKYATKKTTLRSSVPESHRWHLLEHAGRFIRGALTKVTKKIARAHAPLHTAHLTDVCTRLQAQKRRVGFGSIHHSAVYMTYPLFYTHNIHRNMNAAQAPVRRLRP